MPSGPWYSDTNYCASLPHCKTRNSQSMCQSQSLVVEFPWKLEKWCFQTKLSGLVDGGTGTFFAELAITLNLRTSNLKWEELCILVASPSSWNMYPPSNLPFHKMTCISGTACQCHVHYEAGGAAWGLLLYRRLLTGTLATFKLIFSVLCEVQAEVGGKDGEMGSMGPEMSELSLWCFIHTVYFSASMGLNCAVSLNSMSSAHLYGRIRLDLRILQIFTKFKKNSYNTF